MRIIKNIFIPVTIAGIFLSFAPTLAQTRHNLVKDGNKEYEKGEYDEAIARYHTAQRKGNLPEIDFNLGNAHYKSGNLERAAEEYLKTLNDTSATLRSKSLYNLGNALLKAGQPDKAVEAYINSLKLNPEDINTKQNLEYALRMMQQQQQQQKEEQENQDQNQEQNEQQQEQQNQEQKENQEQQQNEQQQEQEQKEQQQRQKEQQEVEQMSEEDALQLLNALQDDEKEVQKKVIQKQMEGKKSKGKNW
jgi:tetratricopeptide (TPR) repeat protein